MFYSRYPSETKAIRGCWVNDDEQLIQTHSTMQTIQSVHRAFRSKRTLRWMNFFTGMTTFMQNTECQQSTRSRVASATNRNVFTTSLAVPYRRWNTSKHFNPYDSAATSSSIGTSAIQPQKAYLLIPGYMDELAKEAISVLQPKQSQLIFKDALWEDSESTTLTKEIGNASTGSALYSKRGRAKDIMKTEWEKWFTLVKNKPTLIPQPKLNEASTANTRTISSAILIRKILSAHLDRSQRYSSMIWVLRVDMETRKCQGY